MLCETKPRFTFEGIHNTKEQIYFNKKAENYIIGKRAADLIIEMSKFSRLTSRCRGGSMTPGKGVHKYKGAGVCFC